RSEPGIAPRLGQPASRSGPAQRAVRSRGRAAVLRKRSASPMADSPPQRIHALLYATPGPDRPLSIHWRGIETSVHGAAPTRSHVEILPTRLSVSLGCESKKNGKPLGFPAQSGFRRRTVVVARPD